MSLDTSLIPIHTLAVSIGDELPWSDWWRFLTAVCKEIRARFLSSPYSHDAVAPLRVHFIAGNSKPAVRMKRAWLSFCCYQYVSTATLCRYMRARGDIRLDHVFARAHDYHLAFDTGMHFVRQCDFCAMWLRDNPCSVFIYTFTGPYPHTDSETLRAMFPPLIVCDECDHIQRPRLTVISTRFVTDTQPRKDKPYVVYQMA